MTRSRTSPRVVLPRACGPLDTRAPEAEEQKTEDFGPELGGMVQRRWSFGGFERLCTRVFVMGALRHLRGGKGKLGNWLFFLQRPA
jgi:hypothetical protein